MSSKSITFTRTSGTEVTVSRKSIKAVLDFLGTQKATAPHVISLMTNVNRQHVNAILECDAQAQAIVKSGTVSPMNQNGHGAYPAWFLNLTQKQQDAALALNVVAPGAITPGSLTDPNYAAAHQEAVGPLVAFLSRTNASPKRVNEVLANLSETVELLAEDAQVKTEQLEEARQMLSLNATLIAKLSGHKGPIQRISGPIVSPTTPPAAQAPEAH